MAIQVRTVDVIDISYYLVHSLYCGCRIESNNSYTGMNQTADVTYMSFVFVIWAHLELSQSLLVTILHSIILCQSVEIIYHYKSNEYFVSKCAIKTQTKEVLVSFPRICQGHSVKLFNRRWPILWPVTSYTHTNINPRIRQNWQPYICWNKPTYYVWWWHTAYYCNAIYIAVMSFWALN